MYYAGCLFCGEREYELLDCHRVVPGEEGGNYHPRNTVACCSNCHRKVHSGLIVVHGKHLCTRGTYVIHYTEAGVEHWKEMVPLR